MPGPPLMAEQKQQEKITVNRMAHIWTNLLSFQHEFHSWNPSWLNLTMPITLGLVYRWIVELNIFLLGFPLVWTLNRSPLRLARKLNVWVASPGVTGDNTLYSIIFHQTVSESRLGSSVIINQISHNDVTAGVRPPFRHHVMNDNVTGGLAKVAQVGSEKTEVSGHQVFLLTKNNHWLV